MTGGRESNGKGRRDTRVTDVEGIVEVIMPFPGVAAEVYPNWINYRFLGKE